MVDQGLAKKVTVREVFSCVIKLLAPERSYYVLTIIYGLGIGVLSLALPVSVQMLINTVVHTGLTAPLVVLTLTLFLLLLLAGLLNALRIYLMDLFSRRFYARMVSEITLRSIYALNPFFQDYNKGSLFNRYFDIMIVQKRVPDLLVSAFTILLQAAVGFILVSFYHPLFLGYILIVIFLIWLIWLTWGGRAILSAVEVSHKKHATAAWLEGLGASNGFFKSERHIEQALTRSDAVTAEYMDRHKRHFRHYFSQTVCFLLLYATASAGLLGLGGWLVIQDELTLGQLVAAELALSVVFVGLSQIGTYLGYFYELCAALDELELFYGVEQEEPGGMAEPFVGDGSIQFVNVKGDDRNIVQAFNFSIPSGSRVLGVAETHFVERELTNFLKRHIRPARGIVLLGGQDIMEIQAHELRQQIIVLDRPSAIEMTIREYLRLSGDKPTSAQIIQAVEIAGLEAAIGLLDKGLDTRIAATGWPLTISGTMQLKLAAALIAKPKLLVLGPLFDTMLGSYLASSLDAIQETSETTVIHFSGRPRDLGFDRFLYLGAEEQHVYSSFEKLCVNMADKECPALSEIIRTGQSALPAT